MWRRRLFVWGLWLVVGLLLLGLVLSPLMVVVCGTEPAAGDAIAGEPGLLTRPFLPGDLVGTNGFAWGG